MLLSSSRIVQLDAASADKVKAHAARPLTRLLPVLDRQGENREEMDEILKFLLKP